MIAGAGPGLSAGGGMAAGAWCRPAMPARQPEREQPATAAPHHRVAAACPRAETSPAL